MSTWGKHIEFSVFGESHGPAIGGVISGLPAGEIIDMRTLGVQMARRRPGGNAGSTLRQEADIPSILSGLKTDENGRLRTNGFPLAFEIRNSDAHSGDYEKLATIPRPGHADYPAYVKYQGKADMRGGGHFSGRLTAPLLFAGSVCRQMLLRRGILLASHVRKIGSIEDWMFSLGNLTPLLLARLAYERFPVISPKIKREMIDEITDVQRSGDSVGGVVECACLGVPAGFGGDGMFEGLEARIASLVLSIPACKGIEFGEGFALAAMTGSQANDQFCMEHGKVATTTNNCGGILGGMADGMPIVFRAAFKPTPSILQTQASVDLEKRTEVSLTISGRHDACVVPRAAPVVEAALALALMDAE